MTSAFRFADLFCGAGGTSTGACEAIEALGMVPELTAVDHWPRAIETHTASHPGARHLCASVDSLSPGEVYPDGGLDLLWASPSCRMHSQGRDPSLPMDDADRCSPFCVTRWAHALMPATIMVENVPQFRSWGPLDSKGRPIKASKGETFRAWLGMIEALGYRVDHRVFCAADYGDPTTRERLFVQAQRGSRRIVWPEPTHSEHGGLFGAKPWVSAEAGVIDWTLPMRSVFGRKKPLAEKTMKRISEGLRRHGGVFIVAMEHGGRVLPVNKPMPTVTCAKGGAFALVMEYYGNGKCHPVSRPLPTATTRDRFALVSVKCGDVLFRMLSAKELARAQGFRGDYIFTGSGPEVTKQIGNAVPRRLARALVLAAVGQRSDVAKLMEAA